MLTIRRASLRADDVIGDPHAEEVSYAPRHRCSSFQIDITWLNTITSQKLIITRHGVLSRLARWDHLSPSRSYWVYVRPLHSISPFPFLHLLATRPPKPHHQKLM